MSNGVWPDIADVRSCAANCHTCVFKKSNGKTPYCVLKNFPILNPDIGCSRRMTRDDFKKSNIKHVSAEELEAYAEANNKKVDWEDPFKI